MLEEILDYIHNYFEQSYERGVFEISSNTLTLDWLQDGQYFKIEGSVFNDGIYQYPCTNLQNEKFKGIVYGLAIPLQVIKIADEVKTWCDENEKVLNSPYQSESFGGYSYSKGNGGGGTNGEQSYSWKNQFGNRLNHWRKIA